MKRIARDIMFIIIGCTFMALGVVLFLLPNRLSSGGFSGIATLLYYLFNFKIGTTTIILNIPLFAIAYFKLGKRFFAKALIRNSNTILTVKRVWNTISRHKTNNRRQTSIKHIWRTSSTE